MRNLNKLFPVMLSLFFLSSCQDFIDSKNPSPPPPPPRKSSIALSEVADSKCLNLEKYFVAVNELYPNPLMREVSNNVVLTSKNSIPGNFGLRMASDNFIFRDTYRQVISDFLLLQQIDCDTVRLKTLGGDVQEYKVTDFTPSSLIFKNENGETYEYAWLSEFSLSTAHEFAFGDYECDSTSNVTIRVEKTISFDPQFIQLTTMTKDTIAEGYLATVVKAKGQQVNQLYDISNHETPDSLYSVSKLSKLAASPLQPQFLLCDK